jgi:ATP-binding protein involved in chromosome partitioning
MPAVDPLIVLQPAASRVRDPVSGRSVWLAGMIQNASASEEKITFDLVFSTGHSRTDRRSIEAAVIANIRECGWEGEIMAMARMQDLAPEAEKPAESAPRAQGTVPGMKGGGMGPHGGPIQKKSLPGVKHILCVASGKGGVGKSTVAVNLAVGLRRIGFSVGLLDADIYGPSLPTMLQVNGRPHADQDKKILPVHAHGIKCLSIGMMMPSDQAVIWRGPMVQGALRDFIQNTRWGALDYLIVDLPPGTGDAQLTLIQSVDLSGAVIVTTPQKVALDDAIRGIAMFKKLNVPILGLVENMAWYELPDGSKDYIFGKGGGVRTAQEHGTDVLAQIPLYTRLRASADEGTPAALSDGPLGEQFLELARAVSGRSEANAE